MSGDGRVRIVSGAENLQAVNADAATMSRDQAVAALLRVIWLLLWVCSPALIIIAWKAAL